MSSLVHFIFPLISQISWSCKSISRLYIACIYRTSLSVSISVYWLGSTQLSYHLLLKNSWQRSQCPEWNQWELLMLLWKYDFHTKTASTLTAFCTVRWNEPILWQVKSVTFFFIKNEKKCNKCSECSSSPDYMFDTAACIMAYFFQTGNCFIFKLQ